MTDETLGLGGRIRMLRDRQGMSQRKLSLEARVPQSTISRLERGDLTGMGTGSLKRLATALRTTTDFLVSEGNERFPSLAQRDIPSVSTIRTAMATRSRDDLAGVAKVVFDDLSQIDKRINGVSINLLSQDQEGVNCYFAKDGNVGMDFEEVADMETRIPQWEEESLFGYETDDGGYGVDFPIHHGALGVSFEAKAIKIGSDFTKAAIHLKEVVEGSIEVVDGFEEAYALREEMHRNEMLIQAILNSSTNTIVITTRNLLAVHGSSDTMPMGQCVLDEIHPEDRKKVREAADRSAKIQQTVKSSARNQKGESYRINVTPVAAEGDVAFSVFEFSVDAFTEEFDRELREKNMLLHGIQRLGQLALSGVGIESLLDGLGRELMETCDLKGLSLVRMKANQATQTKTYQRTNGAFIPIGSEDPFQGEHEAEATKAVDTGTVQIFDSSVIVPLRVDNRTIGLIWAEFSSENVAASLGVAYPLFDQAALVLCMYDAMD
jgi:transcriptional regulator with XRE-family HTH domain